MTEHALEVSSGGDFSDSPNVVVVSGDGKAVSTTLTGWSMILELPDSGNDPECDVVPARSSWLDLGLCKATSDMSTGTTCAGRLLEQWVSACKFPVVELVYPRSRKRRDCDIHCFVRGGRKLKRRPKKLQNE